MTEKRFRVINYSDGSWMYGVSDRIAEITVAWDKSKLIMDNLCDLLNHLYEENIQLKKEYMAMSGNLCDACKHEEEDNTNNWFVGIDYDVKCNKGHEILLDDEEQKCEDFELRLEGYK